MDEEELKQWACGLAGIVAGVGLLSITTLSASKLEEIGLADRFVKPSNVNMIALSDMDSERTKMSVFKYAGRNYLMKYDEKTNTVSIVPYEVKEIERK